MTSTFWIVLAVAIPLIVSLLVALTSHRARDSFDTFVLGGRDISRPHFVATLTASNAALANILFLYVYWGFVYGVWAWLWGMLFWAAGFLLFSRVAKKSRFNDLTQSQRPESGFNELLGVEYASPLVATVCALVSGTAFLLLLTLELNVGAKIFSGLTPTPTATLPYVLALIIGSVLAAYAAFGGMRAVIRTDVVQLLFIGAAALAMPIVIGRLAGTTSIWSLIGTSASTAPAFALTWGYVPFVLGSLFSWGAWFLCTMDMWQRTVATTIPRPVLGIKGMLPSYFLLGVITFSGVLAGVYLKSQATSPFPPKYPLVDLLHAAFVAASSDSVSLVLVAVVVAGFTAAMLSTVDTYLIIVSQSMVGDLPAFRKGFPHARINKTQGEDRILLRNVQRFVAAVPFISVALFYLLNRAATQDTFTLYMIAGSTPFAVLPLVVGALWLNADSRSRMARPAAIWAALSLGVSIVVNLVLAQHALASFSPVAFGLLYFVPLLTALVAAIPFLATRR